ncbi:hypothetical protein [Burkholderia ubonensis]|uniref:hypothetical protein n=1 Tax=Burkholderia ubonensis TaxID=101571 RepID=UPI00016A4C21|nr:hypothetical protein [Burkholderia ubonensis]
MNSFLKLCVLKFAAVIFFVASPLTAGATDVQKLAQRAQSSDISIESILADLRGRSTQSQYEAFANAIRHSPALAAQLNELVRAGLLTRISIDSGEASQGRSFGAMRSGSTWVFTPSFVADQGPRRIHDVVSDDDILPDNMVFALGFMAWRTTHDEEVTKALGAMRESTDAPMAKMEWLVKLNIRIDAGAFIQGWNDVVDAAVRQNRGVPLTVSQGNALMMNLRYRGPLLKAVTAASPNPKLRMESSSIPYDMKNVAALASALQESQLIDIQPMNMRP